MKEEDSNKKPKQRLYCPCDEIYDEDGIVCDCDCKDED